MAKYLQPDALKLLFNGTRKSLSFVESSRLYHSIRVHADGIIPIRLIKKQRPNESMEVMKYRERIYEAETQNPIEKVFNVLEKIRRSPDWMIQFDEDKTPPIIPKEETLKEYLTENYPTYGSIENWLFEEVLRTAGVDANAVIAIMPKDFVISDNAFIQPIAKIFNCTSVLEFEADDYAVLKSDELSSLLSPELQQNRLVATQVNNIRNDNSEIELCDYEEFRVGQVYYHINTIDYQKWEETADGKYQLTVKTPHNLKCLPVFQMPGKFVRRIGNSIVKKSPLHAMVPHLNKAARESSDLDAGVIKHLHPQKWRINNTPCEPCGGLGKVPGSNNMTCKSCKGSGIATGNSPFDEIVIKPAGIGETTTPTPPVGFVVMDTAIIKLQDERIKDHLYKALSAINMEHLSEVPLSQSGVAKGMDRDDAQAIVYMFAEYLTKVIKDCCYFINELRYNNLVPDQEKRSAMLPIIPVPEKFDIINTSFLLEEYKTGKDAGLNSTILAQMQMEIVGKKFYANPKISAVVTTIMSFDPFPDKTIEEKGLMEGQGLAAKEDIILSNYISDFVNQAMEDDATFITKTKDQKRIVLLEMAKKKMDLLNAGKQISQDILGQNPDVAGGVTAYHNQSVA